MVILGHLPLRCHSIGEMVVSMDCMDSWYFRTTRSIRVWTNHPTVCRFCFRIYNKKMTPVSKSQNGDIWEFFVQCTFQRLVAFGDFWMIYGGSWRLWISYTTQNEHGTQICKCNFDVTLVQIPDDFRFHVVVGDGFRFCVSIFLWFDFNFLAW